ncbi:NadS family protein [Acidihalobacter prosperus]|uniref:NadS family protein n=1 Tax=Acidihalobacter prosperus TaxID=160660 RepID=UPI0005069C50|nr:NadS family protein [Acidihalobacter prosperus]
MDKALFDELAESLKEAGKIHRGDQAPSRRFAFDALDVKAIRERTGLSQGRFALLMGVSVRTLQNWEQGRRQPQGPAESLLRIVKNDPQGAMKALHG